MTGPGESGTCTHVELSGLEMDQPGPCPCSLTPTPSVGTGDLTITLTWHSSEGIDLDLRVLEPNENEIYYGDPSSSTGGQLDIDNRCQNYVNGRPENIYWEAAPPGNYRINVNWYGTCGESSETTTSYEVRVINGSGIKTYTGTITAGEVVTVDTITVN